MGRSREHAVGTLVAQGWSVDEAVAALGPSTDDIEQLVQRFRAVHDSVCGQIGHMDDHGLGVVSAYMEIERGLKAMIRRP